MGKQAPIFWEILTGRGFRIYGDFGYDRAPAGTPELFFYLPHSESDGLEATCR